MLASLRAAPGGGGGSWGRATALIQALPTFGRALLLPEFADAVDVARRFGIATVALQLQNNLVIAPLPLHLVAPAQSPALGAVAPHRGRAGIAGGAAP